MIEELCVDGFVGTTFEDFERMAEAIEAFGIAMCEVIEPILDDIRESIDWFWLYIRCAYLADHWHLGWVAWYLPDWLVRKVPLDWVVAWLRCEMGVEEE